MSSRGWFALDGRRIFAGPFEEPPTLDLVKTWLHQDLTELAHRALVTDEELQRRLRAVRIDFGVRASRGGFKRLAPPSFRGAASGA